MSDTDSAEFISDLQLDRTDAHSSPEEMENSLYFVRMIGKSETG
jgi:hypothetical protein